jgi:galactan endo-1,6-beta-galactosidase
MPTSNKDTGLRWLCTVIIALLLNSGSLFQIQAQQISHVKVDPRENLGHWEGWGSSLAWWARAIGGTSNADFYADLIYTTNVNDGYPGLGLNIVRYNVGGGGIDQAGEHKGPKLQWQMDIHGYWADPSRNDPTGWNWSVDNNQRSMMQKARERGANIFQLFSDSPMWWMNSNHSTAGNDSGGDCLRQDNYGQFAFYLAAVARHSADNWGIKFNSIEPFNEPSADWWKYPGRQEGCHFDIRTQQRILERLRRALDDVHLDDVAVAAADENNIDAGLNTWNAYSPAVHRLVGQIDVHGYSNGTEPYRGPNRAELRRAVGGMGLWQSEYGDGDASGYKMAQAIIQDLRELHPSAWVYWQPVEPDIPEYGWGLMNANYVDTHDQLSPEKTRLVRINRKFYVYGQFTRYIRPGFQLIGIDDPNSIAAYNHNSQKLVVVKVTGDASELINIDLAAFAKLGDTTQVITTTTAPNGSIPDCKQQTQILRIDKQGVQRAIKATLHPKSIYTFVTDAVLR